MRPPSIPSACIRTDHADQVGPRKALILSGGGCPECSRRSGRRAAGGTPVSVSRQILSTCALPGERREQLLGGTFPTLERAGHGARLTADLGGLTGEEQGSRQRPRQHLACVAAARDEVAVRAACERV